MCVCWVGGGIFFFGGGGELGLQHPEHFLQQKVLREAKRAEHTFSTNINFQSTHIPYKVLTLCYL